MDSAAAYTPSQLLSISLIFGELLLCLTQTVFHFFLSLQKL